MAMGKSFRLYERDNTNSPYSVLVEQRNKENSLLLESDIAAVLSNPEKDFIKKQYTKILDAYGCLGILQVNGFDGTRILYLVVVTGCISLGKILDSELFKITQTAFLSLRKQPGDDDLIADLRKLLNSGTFYFSWSPFGDAMDITLCAQRRKQTTNADNRFFWNKTLYIHLIRYGVDCSLWLLKIMCGSVEIRTVYVGHRQGKAVIISRLSSERAGTRFHVRGVNDHGHVANFVETEQAIYMENAVSSFIQIRGSVPLFWEQTGVQVGQHKVKMSRGPESTAAAFNKHIELIKERYGHQTIVNLLGTCQVGPKESEGMLSTLFQQQQEKSNHTDIPHFIFDYHQECRGGSIKNLNKLRTKIEPYMKAYSVFFSQGNEIISKQQGTIRTNCLDCLDRTNCVQTYFGLLMLNKQLEYLNLLEKQQSISRFEEVFKQMWVDNGNEVSKIYAGTGAIQGGSKIMDGARSAARTIQNNLLDTGKQEAIDILLWGSSLNNVIADRSRTLLDQSMMFIPNNILNEMCNRYKDYTESKTINLGIGTYNVNGGKHFRSVAYKDVSLSDWLLDAYTTDQNDNIVVDLYAIGFEEIVDLNASNIMAASSENAKSWAEELQKILSRDRKYALVTYVQLVGVCLFLFIREDIAQYLKDVGIDSVKTGLGGATGNKGGVAIRCILYNTSLCFICAHFAAGQSQVNERNSDYIEITKKLLFPMGATLKSHDYVFWCGDFNYRIDMDKDQLKELIKENDLETILHHDQLNIQKELGLIFKNFKEGTITFPPTYKYDLFSDDYDTSEKARAPAWTDRVLWKRRQFIPGITDPGKLLFYGIVNLKQSDHRPVIAFIELEVVSVNEERRENIFNEIILNQGPSNATLFVESIGRSSKLLEENIKMKLIDYLGQLGDILIVRQTEDTIAIMFKESKSCLDIYNSGDREIEGIVFKFTLSEPDWGSNIHREISLCKNNTVPLCEYCIPTVTENDLLKQPENLSGRSTPVSENKIPPRPPQPVPKVVAGVMSIPLKPKSESLDRSELPPPSLILSSPKRAAEISSKLPKKPPGDSNNFKRISSIEETCRSPPAPMGPPPPLPGFSSSPPPIPPRTSAPPPIPSRNK